MKTNNGIIPRIVLIGLLLVCGTTGPAMAARDGGYDVTGKLWAKAVLQVATTPVTPVTLVWKEVGTDTTPSGAKVVSGYFYADPADFTYGSVYNPEVFVKVYIDPSGWCNMAFNHVTVDNVAISSAHNYNSSADQTATLSTYSRLVEQQYSGVSISSIVGGWTPVPSEGDYTIATFYANGTYIVYDGGVEYGTYTHDSTTGVISVTVLRDENGENGMADAGTPYQNIVILNGDTFTAYDGDVAEDTMERVKSDSSPIVGSWTPVPSEGDYVMVTFFANGTYIVYDDGVEYGTYSHDNTTGQINVNVIRDDNGDYGMADSGTPYQDKAFVNGDMLTIYLNDVLDGTLERVK